MQIAIIGWGSLIWCPGCLRIKSIWHSDGPLLPIEFARISSDQRLTLVIHPGSPNQRAYWARSEFDNLQKARKNLGAREGTKNLKRIHSIPSTPDQEKIDQRILTKIRKWLKTQKNLQAAVWTGLESNWEDHHRGAFRAEDAVRYLRELERAKDDAKQAFDRAREYIRNTPPQIQTPVRKKLRKRKGWEDAQLPPILFQTTNAKSRS